MSMSSMNITNNNLMFLPEQDFNKPWIDEELYAKYGLDVEMDDNMPTQRRFVRLIIQKMKFSEKRRNSLLFILV